MPFEKVEPSPDFPALERKVLNFWAEHGTFAKRKALNAGKPKWSFLDGPITANNPMGVHHAWGRTYKDAYCRYFAMAGHELRYQNGFDCQGLWVEVEVEKELQLKSKRDIENLVPGNVEASIDKFVQACKDRVNTFARVQTEQSIRLGMWMNWDVTDEDWARSPDERHSYFTMSETNNYAIWSFLKKCHAKRLISRGYDVMPWCGRCGVGISEQEMKEGYKLVEHRACLVKLPLLDMPGENLLVWTTTPWTLTSNVGAAINPKLTYLKVKLKNEIYYLAKGVFKQDRMASSGGDEEDTTAKKGKREWIDGVPNLSSIEQMFKSKAGKGESYEIVGEVKGEEMLGWRYAGPFDDLPAQQSEYGFPEEVAKIVKQNGWCPAVTGAAAHRVVSGGDDVSESEGTGIVHTAPGCGGIDFAWGKANGLPPVAPIGDDGCFHKGFGSLEGKNAADPATADAVFEELKKKDRLFGTERYVHRYPHCWRCKTELLYRLVDEWFIGMGSPFDPANPQSPPGGYSFRAEIAKVTTQVTFLPESLNGRARELDWLKNMGDWMISKKRYWGLSLPIWVDEKDPTDFEVIGSREELKERAIEGWTEFDGHTPHRPWVDKIVLKNPRTGSRMFRIPDVGNPWLDAGIVAYSTLPADWRPADFITESFPGQFRNWFYALLALSTMMSDGQPPFKTLLGFATAKDQFGHDMHKSAGNSIEFNKAADEGGEIKDPKGNAIAFNAIGADVMRWLYCRQNPASNLLFGPKPADEVRAKFHLKLWNCYSFFVNYAIADNFDPMAAQVPAKERPDIDRWILSDLQGLIRTARESFEAFDVMRFALEAERFVDDRLSNWYVRRNRDRFWSNNAALDDAGRRDKLAAYQTMHTVLTTLCRLIAPCVPFLAEVMWGNLTAHGRSSVGFAPSVHLESYPTVDESLIDSELSEDTDQLLSLVSMVAVARKNGGQEKVRQPLAEVRIFAGNDAMKRAVIRFTDQIVVESNIRKVTLVDSPPLAASAKLNMKTAGAKIGPNRKEVDAAMKAISADELAKRFRAGPVEFGGVMLDAEDITIQYHAPDGWAGVADRGTQVGIDIRITPELRAEGLSRDVIRLVQENRKKARLELADKIVLHVATTSEELGDVIVTHKDAIMAAVQAVEIVAGQFELASVFGVTNLEVGQLTIGIRKADG
jgi:isoleucyl-tRNA synthetase